MEQKENYEQCKYFEIASTICPKRKEEIMQQALQCSRLQPYNGIHRERSSPSKDEVNKLCKGCTVFTQK